jgi:hypothetical protein
MVRMSSIAQKQCSRRATMDLEILHYDKNLDNENAR